ncbi:MAG: hypothetical protein IKE91_07605 [Clostridia bacterium]|nr:hypothetical protein [Clostridia bacterium]
MSNNRESFLESIKYSQDKELIRLMELKRKYDNEEITEEDISEEDAEKLLRLYEIEIENIKKDTNNAKERIKKELAELKRQNMNKK